MLSYDDTFQMTGKMDVIFKNYFGCSGLHVRSVGGMIEGSLLLGGFVKQGMGVAMLIKISVHLLLRRRDSCMLLEVQRLFTFS